MNWKTDYDDYVKFYNKGVNESKDREVFFYTYGFGNLFEEEVPRVKWLGERLEDKKNLRILDVGCGTGVFCCYLALKGHRVTGIDIVNQFIELAKIKRDELDLSITYEVSLAEKYRSSKKFDVIVAFEVVEHVIDEDKFLTNLERLLKPDGTIFITTPGEEGEWGKDGLHLRVFNEKNMREMLEKRGKVVDCLYYGKDRLIHASYQPFL